MLFCHLLWSSPSRKTLLCFVVFVTSYDTACGCMFECVLSNTSCSLGAIYDLSSLSACLIQ